ncbi:MAG: restriction endonuclease subunit S [Fibrobacter sp.]|nr:restriction endonuclease subunit S [Fibrobacter sp.]
MNMEMTKYKLGDIATIYDGPHATPKRTDNGPVYLGIDAITEDCKINPNEFTFLSEDDYKIWTKRVVPQFKDIVFSYEATLGRYAIIPENFYGCLGRRLGIIRVKSDAVDYKWLYYFFQSPQWKCYIKNHIIKGSTVNRISVDEMPGYEIPACGIADQKKIAAVLSALDDKIALNKKMNQKLEAMAKRLYDYWFVQYDFPDKNGHPYKTTGGPMTYNLTLKREIPEGWKVDNLYAVADYINGLACQNNRPKSGENALPVIKIREMSEGITSDTEEVSENIPSKYIVENGDILFSWSATLLVMIWAGGKGGLNQHIFKVVPKDGFPKEFVYQLLSDYVVNFQQIALSRKTTMGHITSDHINLSRVVLPPENVLKRYAEKVCPIFDKIVRNQVEFRKLTALRDKLLPLLMNGQVVV